MNPEKQAFDRYYSGLLEGTVGSEDLPPAILSQYRVTACQAQTETKRIYQAERIRDGLACIIRGTPPKARESALREAKILRRLSHPGIPRLLRVFRWRRWVFFIREFCDGKPVDMLVAGRGALPADEVYQIGRQVVEIVHYLHQQSPPVIHRDIKPHNLILTPEGNIRLIDFGIAREYDPTVTHDTTSLGSYGYAAPEQFGLTQSGPRADLFGVGMLLYFLATGKNKEYVSTLRDVPILPLRGVIRRSTRLDARHRYANAGRLAFALEVARWLTETAPRMTRPALACLLAAAIALTGFSSWSTLIGPVLQSSGLLGSSHNTSALHSPLLESAVRQALGMAESESITDGHLQMVQSLTVSARDEEDASWFPREPAVETLQAAELDQLHLFPNLTELTLIRQDIRDLTPLAGLNLTRLELEGNNVISLQPLRSMPTLRHLGLGRNPVIDLSPLAALPELESLDIRYTEVHLLDALRHLQNLRELDLRGIKTTDLSMVQGLENLESLRIADTQVKDFSFLGELHKLEVLELRSAGFGDLSQIASTALRSLDVSWNYNFLSDLSGIERFTELEQLDLSYTAVQDMAILESLPALRVLELDSATRVLPRLPGLQQLVVTGEGNDHYWQDVSQAAQVEIVMKEYPLVYSN